MIFLQTPPGLAGAVPAAHPQLPAPPPQPCLCSPVEADLVETLFAGLVYGIEAGARVLLLTAVWMTDEIRLGVQLGAQGWGRMAPNLAHWRLDLILGSKYTLRPLIQPRHTHTHIRPTCTHNILGLPNFIQRIYRYTNSQPHFQAYIETHINLDTNPHTYSHRSPH